jgi:hypothetical protein
MKHHITQYQKILGATVQILDIVKTVLDDPETEGEDEDGEECTTEITQLDEPDESDE